MNNKISKFQLICFFSILFLISCQSDNSSIDKPNSSSIPQNIDLNYVSLQKAAIRALDYFKCNYDNINNPDALVILEELQQLYSLDFNLENKLENERFNDFNKILKRLYQKEYVLNKNDYETYLANVKENFNKYSVMALYCDYYPLENDFLNILQEKINIGGYETTHAGFQLQIALNNGCFKENDKRIKELKDLLKIKLIETVENEGITTDIGIEAIAVLNYIGFKNDKKTEWFKQIINNQNLDGGWSPKKEIKESHPHTAGLALWIILEELYEKKLNIYEVEKDSYQKLIENEITVMNQVLYLVMYYQYKKFGIKWANLPLFQKSFDKYNDGTTPFYKMYYGVLSPCYNKSFNDIDKFSSTSYVYEKSRYSLYGLYCDRLEGIDNLIPAIDNIKKYKDDEIIDFILMIEWMNENNCKEIDISKYKKEIILKLIQNIENNLSINRGTAIESIAMLYYLGQEKLVKKEWIDEAIYSLNNFSQIYENTPIKDHRPLVYGYWIYLENLNPKVKHVQWIDTY